MDAAGRRTADGIRRLLVRHGKFVDQALQAKRFFKRIEVLALDILDQRHRQRRFVRNLAYQRRHFRQAG